MDTNDWCINGTYRRCCSSRLSGQERWTDVVLETYTCTDDPWLPNVATARIAATECACALSSFNCTAGDSLT